MPILAVDKMGRIYETSPDREDGQGIKDYPSQCDQQDNTLGNAYLKAQAKNRDLVMRERMNQKMIEHQNKIEALRHKQAKLGAMRKEEMHQRVMNSPKMQQHLIKKALLGCGCGRGQGCTCNNRVGVMGNVMSANGQDGYRGMDRTQKAIHHALNPSRFPKNTAFGVDPLEQKQLNERLKAYEILKRRSRGMSRG